MLGVSIGDLALEEMPYAVSHGDMIALTQTEHTATMAGLRLREHAGGLNIGAIENYHRESG